MCMSNPIPLFYSPIFPLTVKIVHIIENDVFSLGRCTCMKEDIRVACYVSTLYSLQPTINYEKCKYARQLVNHTIVWNRSFMIGLPNMWCYLSPVVALTLCLYKVRREAVHHIYMATRRAISEVCAGKMYIPICCHTNECSAVWAHSMVIISLMIKWQVIYTFP